MPLNFPLSDEEIGAIPEINEVPSGEVCSICLREFQENNLAIRQLPCNHNFHGECIIPWLQTCSSCPTCRHQLGEDRQLEEVLNQIYDGDNDDLGDDDVIEIESGDESFGEIFEIESEDNDDDDDLNVGRIESDDDDNNDNDDLNLEGIESDDSDIEMIEDGSSGTSDLCFSSDFDDDDVDMQANDSSDSN